MVDKKRLVGAIAEAFDRNTFHVAADDQRNQHSIHRIGQLPSFAQKLQAHIGRFSAVLFNKNPNIIFELAHSVTRGSYLP